MARSSLRSSCFRRRFGSKSVARSFAPLTVSDAFLPLARRVSQIRKTLRKHFGRLEILGYERAVRQADRQLLLQLGDQFDEREAVQVSVTQQRRLRADRVGRLAALVLDE